MSGTTVAKIQWRALDREGEDKCRLARLDTGWMLVGHARFRSVNGWAALDYLVRLNEDWRTTSADVSGTDDGAPVAIRLIRGEDGWTVNDKPRPDLDQAEDVDLSFTPATNLMPLNRLPEVGRITTTVAWIRYPGGAVSSLTQAYTRERGGQVHYEAQETGYDTHLSVNSHGFVTSYPGRWEAMP